MKENLLNKLIIKLKEEQVNIKKCNEIDKKHYNMNVDINKLIEISEKMKKEDLKEDIDKDVIVIHNGNPYITYILAIKALCNNINMKIYINEVMVGTNLILGKIVTQVIKEIKLENTIEIKRKLAPELTEESRNKKIIVLGDKDPYFMLLEQKVENVYYRPKFNVAMYVENEQLEELKQNILNYCYSNFIEIEIYEAENVQDAIKEMKMDNDGEKIMLLTNEKINARDLEGLDISINENILKNLEEVIIREKIL